MKEGWVIREAHSGFLKQARKCNAAVGAQEGVKTPQQAKKWESKGKAPHTASYLIKRADVCHAAGGTLLSTHGVIN